MTLTRLDPLQMLADMLDPADDRYLTLPGDWCRDRLKEDLTVKQDEILDAIVEDRHVAVMSCHDVGKSFIGARVAAWWIDVHPLGEAFVVTTAPTAAQVAAILWRELARAHRKGNLPGRLTATCEWKVSMGTGPDELIAYGRKPADYDPAAFQGIHERYVLIIIDEGCGVPKTIFDAAESIATNKYARVLVLGNPDDPASYFAEICKPGSGWKVIHIDALTSPNFTRDEVAKHPHLRRYMINEGIVPTTEETAPKLRDLLVSPTWAEERLKRWGPNSPMFVSKVRGRFPSITKDTLIHPHWVKLAQLRECNQEHVDPRMGVDVARYGTDHTILVLRLGNHARVVHDIPYGPVTETAGLIQEIGRGRINTPIANVDDTGVGGGVTDILREERYPCLPLIASAPCSPSEILPNGKPKFVNARSEWWWRLREALAGQSGTGEDGLLDLDEDDDELAAQITNMKYRINRHGQIEVEPKDSLRARQLPSPDRGDALCYSLVGTPLAPEEMVVTPLMLTHDLLTMDW